MQTEEKLEQIHGERQGIAGRVKAALMAFLKPALVEAGILTFLAEWGDRSQIATITMAAEKDPVMVTIGAILGHSAW